MPRLRTLAFVLPLAIVLAGCAAMDEAAQRNGAPGPTVVAEYSGTTLTLQEFEEQYARTTGSRERSAEDSFDDYADFLERYVDFRLKVDEARRIGLHHDPEIIEEVQTYREQLAQPFLIERNVLDGIIRDLYEKQMEEVAASHILLQVDQHASPADTLAAYQRMSAIRDSVVASDLDFSTAAVRHSEDPSAAQNQGNLGYFTGGRMILAFEQMAYDTPVGEVSPVFRSQFGYHILQVTDRRPREAEIRASHILIRLAPDASEADSAAAYAQMDEIQARLAAGEEFSGLARELSEDPGSGQRGGDLGFFGRDRMVAEFSEAAYALEDIGDRSDVVRSQFGLHLIELTERQSAPTYEEAYDDLKRLAEQLPRTHERRREIGRAHRAEVGSSLDTTAVLQALEDLPDGEVLQIVGQQGFGEHENLTVAQIGNESFTLGDLTPDLRNARVNPAPNQRLQVVDLIDQALDERAVTLAARDLENRDEEFRRIMADYADGVLLFRLAEDSVWTAAARDTVGLRAFYDERAHTYTYPERRRVVAFFTRSDSLSALAATRIETENAAEVFAALAENGEDTRTRVDTLYLAAPSGGPFDRAFDLEEGQAAERLQHRGEYVILYHDGIEAPREMTFDEARARVITEYQDELDRRLLERLRREANVRLYPDRLSAAFADVEDGATASDDDASSETSG